LSAIHGAPLCKLVLRFIENDETAISGEPRIAGYVPVQFADFKQKEVLSAATPPGGTAAIRGTAANCDATDSGTAFYKHI